MSLPFDGPTLQGSFGGTLQGSLLLDPSNERKPSTGAGWVIDNAGSMTTSEFNFTRPTAAQETRVSILHKTPIIQFDVSSLRSVLYAS